MTTRCSSTAPQQADNPAVEMYAISLWQPWASFIAAGIKPYETRSWAPPRWLIGKRIAIHAAKKAVDADNREWARRYAVNDLPLGSLVCTCVLWGAYQCGPFGTIVNPALPIQPQQILAFDLPPQPLTVPGRRVKASRLGSATLLSIPEDEFGDYAEDRWAWWLTDIEPLDPPVSARGAQGFWKLTAPPTGPVNPRERPNTDEIKFTARDCIHWPGRECRYPDDCKCYPDNNSRSGTGDEG